MDKLRALSAYGSAYLAARPGSTLVEARQWMEQTGLAAGTAADLAALGYTPTVVAWQMEQADEVGADPDQAVDAMLYGLPHRTVTLTHGDPQYTALLDQIRADQELVDRWWADAESRPDELDAPGTSWSVTLVEDGDQEVPAAWAAARVEDGVLRAMCNYEHPWHRGRGLYAAAYQERHRSVILPSGLPGLTYLYAQPLALHESDGWYRTGVADTSREPGIEPHDWWELRRDA